MPSGRPGSTSFTEYTCQYCKKTFKTPDYFGPRKYCSIPCANRGNARSGELNSSWKNGIHIDKDGRVREYIGKNKNGHRIYEARYRLKMAKKIGRPLTSSDIVHHKDENTSNDQDENLELTTRSEHARIHCTKEKIVRYCKHCNKRMELTMKLVKRNRRYCSQTCANRANAIKKRGDAK